MSEYKNKLECPKSTIENKNVEQIINIEKKIRNKNTIIDKIKNIFYKKTNKVININCIYNDTSFELSRDQNELSNFLTPLGFVNFEDNDADELNTLLLKIINYKENNNIINIINIVVAYASENNYKYIIIDKNIIFHDYDKILIKFINVKDNEKDTFYPIYYIKIDKQSKYINKYLKYKQKYLELKKQHHIIN